MRQLGRKSNLSLVLPLGIKEKIYQRQLTWKIFQAVARRRGRSIGHPSLAFLLFLPLSSRPFKSKIDLSEPTRVPPSKTIVPTSSQPSQRVPMNLLENEDLA